MPKQVKMNVDDYVMEHLRLISRLGNSKSPEIVKERKEQLDELMSFLKK